MLAARMTHVERSANQAWNQIRWQLRKVIVVIRTFRYLGFFTSKNPFISQELKEFKPIPSRPSDQVHISMKEQTTRASAPLHNN